MASMRRMDVLICFAFASTAALLQGCGGSSQGGGGSGETGTCTKLTMTVATNLTKPCNKTEKPATLEIQQQIGIHYETKADGTPHDFTLTSSSADPFAPHSETWKQQGDAISQSAQLFQIKVANAANKQACVLLATKNTVLIALAGEFGAAGADCPHCGAGDEGKVFNAWLTLVTSATSYTCAKEVKQEAPVVNV
eukprot:TRINITY_DN24166_c0_g1_i3.p1 TRINITY_DN24166_c0_g1~~TRINITY_DN24166_c0_g1_i3.p1  ORF type:complete len:195 (-),score=43.75 TRINITY_DN24166_c0_g1_i3:441-1025(-)